jgi:hypothetical protein
MQNFNGQEPYLNQQMAYRRNPEGAAKGQSELNDKRFKRVQKARAARPFVLPLNFKFAAAGRVTPYTVTTDRLEWAIDYLGASHNLPGLVNDMNIRRGAGDRYLASLDPETQAQAKIYDFAQHGETQGALYYPSPFAVERHQTMNLDVYKSLNSGVAESRFICLTGQRTFKADDSESKIDSETEARVRELIKARRIPEIRVLTMAVNFKNGGAAAGDIARDMRTNDAEEPLLIRAIRTTSLRYSTCRIAIRGEEYWMPREAPVWSLAALQGLYTFGNWMFLKTPVLLPEGGGLVGDFTNSGADEDAAHFDTPDAATNKTLTVNYLAETV